MINGCKMTWNVLASGHGKGPHDGANVVNRKFFKKFYTWKPLWKLPWSRFQMGYKHG